MQFQAVANSLSFRIHINFFPAVCQNRCHALEANRATPANADLARDTGKPARPLPVPENKKPFQNERVYFQNEREHYFAIWYSSMFREDLFYRLNVFSIELPPLRERTEDIPALAAYFVTAVSAREKQIAPVLDKQAIQLLSRYPWPGNVRELRNVMERAVILTDGNSIGPDQFPYEIQKQDSAITNSLSLAAVEKKHIEKVLQYTGANKTKTAELLGIGLTTLYRKMEEYQIAK